MTGTRSQSHMRWTYRYGVICSLGLACTIIGTFLSWFRSGEVHRNSYETAALIERVEPVDHPVVDALPAAWGTVPLLCAACVALFVIRLFRTAAITVVVSMAIVGTAAVLTLVPGGDGAGTFGTVATGPITTIAGVATAVLGAIGVLVTRRGARSREAQQ